MDDKIVSSIKEILQQRKRKKREEESKYNFEVNMSGTAER